MCNNPSSCSIFITLNIYDDLKFSILIGSARLLTVRGNNHQRVLPNLVVLIMSSPIVHVGVYNRRASIAVISLVNYWSRTLLQSDG